MLTSLLSSMKRKAGGFKSNKRFVTRFSVQRYKIKQRAGDYLTRIGDKLNLSMWSAFK